MINKKFIRERAALSNCLELMKSKDHPQKPAFEKRLLILTDLVHPRYEVLYEREYELLKAPKTIVTIIRSTVLDITSLYPLNRPVTFTDLAGLQEKEMISSWFSKLDNRTQDEFIQESILEYYSGVLDRTEVCLGTIFKSINHKQ